MSPEYPNVLPLAVASERYGIAYPTLRELVNSGVFTRVVFDAQAEKPPIFVPIRELDAWKQGGFQALAALKHPVPAHDIGGEA